MYDGWKKAISFGIREEDAVRAAPCNPACALWAEDTLPPDAEKRVFLGGKELTNGENCYMIGEKGFLLWEALYFSF